MNSGDRLLEISEKVPIITNADADDSIDILQLAGSTHVFQFTKMLGKSLARRTLGRKRRDADKKLRNLFN